MSRTDINHVAETILVPLLRDIYGLPNLRNLNDTERANYPGIDLADDSAGVAIQVTSTASSKKVKDTLATFVEHGLYESYSQLIVYILVEKQKTYSGQGFDDIIGGRFQFDKGNDIRDYRDLLGVVQGFQIDRAQRILNILEANFGENAPPLFPAPAEKATETIYLNLLEITFPHTLYVAGLDVDREAVITNSRVKGGAWLKNNAPTRNVVREAMAQQGYRFAVDWVCHKGQLLTFHDLRDSDINLSRVVDSGTVDQIAPDEYWSVNEDLERVFKSLLGRCMQQKLYQDRVVWQHQDKLFIFSEMGEQPKREEKWVGKVKAKRRVYKRTMKNNKPDEIFRCEHLAFKTQYKRFGNRWYVLISPDWFISIDGYKRSPWGADRIKYLKKKEKNQQVFNHLRFILYFLTHEKEPDLFTKRYPYRFIGFKEFMSFDNGLALDDKDWLPAESKGDQTFFLAGEEVDSQ